MKLFASVIVCAAALYWADLVFSNGTYFSALYTVATQMVAHF